MFWFIHQLLLGLHILLAIVWVGGIFFVGWGVYPTVKKMSISEQRRFLSSLMQWTHWLFTAAGIGVITTGILLGTVVGPIHNWQNVWNTTYGNIWFTALVIALFTLAWGVFVGYKQSMKVFADDVIWNKAESGDMKPLNKSMTMTTVAESVEVIGFIALIICMVLLG
ncbi:hypothetical protein [Lentibacillus sp. Marseille-P4043]|uniref:hypothetical protein n=1 Tax=Lentibacillus sp. Marseille-P4043 TaxID=2040293 RepID=UPI000D0B0DBE|nr:hypothetical protein [Lentibacillus sp. Marseille-P4043]